MNKRDIGEALDTLADDVRQQVLSLVIQADNVQSVPIAVEAHRIALIKQAVDTPRRAKAQIQNWITQYDARNGVGAGQTFLQECLTAAASAKTLASINTEVTTLESQAQTMVNNVNNLGWTYDQVATALQAAIAPRPPEEDFTYNYLPIPNGYVTIWGEPW